MITTFEASFITFLFWGNVSKRSIPKSFAIIFWGGSKQSFKKVYLFHHRFSSPSVSSQKWRRWTTFLFFFSFLQHPFLWAGIPDSLLAFSRPFTGHHFSNFAPRLAPPPSAFPFKGFRLSFRRAVKYFCHLIFSSPPSFLLCQLFTFLFCFYQID